MAEAESGKPNFNKLVADGKKHQIEEVGAKLRGLMPWLAANKIVDTAKN
jgi:ketol-acid reductoisomerase